MYRGCANLLARAAGRQALPGAEVPCEDSRRSGRWSQYCSRWVQRSVVGPCIACSLRSRVALAPEILYFAPLSSNEAETPGAPSALHHVNYLAPPRAGGGPAHARAITLLHTPSSGWTDLCFTLESAPDQAEIATHPQREATNTENKKLGASPLG